jgi:hypothetical protein
LLNVEPGSITDFLCARTSDTVDGGKRDLGMLVVREVYACDAAIDSPKIIETYSYTFNRLTIHRFVGRSDQP